MAPPPRPVGLPMARSSSVRDHHSAMTHLGGSSLYPGPGIHSTFRSTSSGPQWNCLSSTRSQVGARSNVELPRSPLGGNNLPIHNDDPGRQPISGRPVAQGFNLRVLIRAVLTKPRDTDDNKSLGHQETLTGVKPSHQDLAHNLPALFHKQMPTLAPLLLSHLVPFPQCPNIFQPSPPQVNSLAPRTEATILLDLIALSSRLEVLNEHYQIRLGEKNHGLFDTIFEKFVDGAWNILALDMVCGDRKQVVPCPKASELADKIIDDLPRLSNADSDDFDPIVALDFKQRVDLVYKAVLEREGGIGVFKWSC